MRGDLMLVRHRMFSDMPLQLVSEPDRFGCVVCYGPMDGKIGYCSILFVVGLTPGARALLATQAGRR